jgi:hypothetical protein
MNRLVKPGSQEEKVGRLVLAAVLVVFLPALPLGNYIAYPFVILATWFHEMGHGMTALLMGFDFERLEILSNGSGVAISRVPPDASNIAQGLVSAGGPLGPAIVGSVLILASSRERYWRPALLTLAAVIGISTLIWVRSLTGWLVLPLVALSLTAIAMKANEGVTRFTLQFLGIHAALSMFSQWDYLLMEQAVIGGRPILSDTGAMEQHLWLPHWLWAGLIIITATAMILASLRYALRPQLPDNIRQFRP